MSMKKNALLLGAAGLLCVLPACGAGQNEAEALKPDTDVVEQAVYTDHAIVTCQSATMYGNYSTTTGPASPIRTLYYGDKVGIRQDAGYPSWALILDYGPDDWGFVLRSCLTRCAGPNNPIAGCF
ncbi:hypothetical protein [Vitiosangium sp. GDMCC 1.1324]|uniref:hypothetical protein n=1 Tax=Vitiosangium sp. (strain GDMCC 1.1324) TaxID=2138576 RepID=UPI000D334CDD|nr:hypothetical protein [Vitiosangium sp. GDMCC 1.1324]PTL84265.1 hypothetical protein DAT35_12625 [Vitiosangium sp. GDMCC 1.1324]